jgi:hypothetical protein
MLTLMQRIARALVPARTALLGLAFLSGGCAGVAILGFEASEGDLILLPALVFLLWSVLGLAFIDLFVRIPGNGPTPAQGWRGILLKLRRSVYWALAIGYLVVGLVAVDVSFSIAREWLADWPHVS